MVSYTAMSGHPCQTKVVFQRFLKPVTLTPSHKKDVLLGEENIVIKSFPITYRHCLKHINLKSLVFLVSVDAIEFQLLIKNLKIKSNSYPMTFNPNFEIASCLSQKGFTTSSIIA